MSSFNKVILMGNLTRTPELRTIPSGTQVTDITLAVNETFNDSSGQRQERTSFVDITVWGKRAEVLCRWKKKGDPLLVEGRLQQDKWVDKQSGQNRSKLKVVCDNFTFVGGGGGGQGGGGNRGGGNQNQGGGNYNQGGGQQGGGGQQDGGNDFGGGPGGYDDYATSLPNNGGEDEPPF